MQWPQWAFSDELVRRVLRVVDQQVGAVAQLEHLGGDVEAAVEGLLVIADVDDRDALHLDPVADRRTDVGDAAGPHLGVADGVIAVGQAVEADVAGEVADPHREVRRPHELAEGLLERQASSCTRAVDVELGAGDVAPARRTAGPARDPSAGG